jgi:hypothetical protein
MKKRRIYAALLDVSRRFREFREGPAKSVLVGAQGLEPWTR